MTTDATVQYAILRPVMDIMILTTLLTWDTFGDVRPIRAELRATAWEPNGRSATSGLASA